MADGMMGNPYLGLLNLGLSPEQAQAEVDKQRAMQFANLNPQQRIASGIYGGLTQVSRALGARDPMLEQASQLRQLAGQFDTTTSEGMMQYANALRQINPQMSQQAVLQARQMMQAEAAAGKTKAETAKIERELSQDEQLRKELANLPENATEEDMLRVVRKFGKTTDVLKGLEAKINLQANIAAKADAAKAAAAEREQALSRTLENRVLIAQLQGANATQLAQMRLDAQKQLEELRQSNKIDLFKIQQEIKGIKPLAAGLQTAEDKDLAQILNNKELISTLDRPINALTSGTLKLGPVANLGNTLRNWSNSSNEASQAYADMQRAIQAATNIKVSAEKGVQTDKDVERFAKELIAAAGGNDTKVLLQALDNFKKASENDIENKKKMVQNRRKSQNVGLYDFEGEFSPTKSTPQEDKFTVGRIYEDAKGNRAKYLGNGKWENQ